MIGLLVRSPGPEQTSLTLRISATGGEGADAGHGGSGGAGMHRTVIDYSDGSQIWTETARGGPNGAGGDGGHGGDAFARIFATDLVLGSANDSVILDLQAQGAAGGARGYGGRMSPLHPPDGPYPYPYDWFPAADGDDGDAGRNGASIIELIDNTLVLGGGGDHLGLYLRYGGPGPAGLTFTGNRFDGGAGRDLLDLGESFLASGFTGRVFGARVDVGAGTLAIGPSPANEMRNFEDFRGTHGDDVFIDGAGSRLFGSARRRPLRVPARRQRPRHRLVRSAGGRDCLRRLRPQPRQLRGRHGQHD